MGALAVIGAFKSVLKGVLKAEVSIYSINTRKTMKVST